MEASVYRINERGCNKETLHQYITTKVKKNLDIIKSARQIRPLLNYDELVVNGVSYPNLSRYIPYLSEDYLMEVFINDRCAVIHGDLTIQS